MKGSKAFSSALSLSIFVNLMLCTLREHYFASFSMNR
uniref:Uncharacterized protein n=1 Tax=Rhizophora mucronata TaxID=61149 RepID=A0A2P2QR33_RHIMU